MVRSRAVSFEEGEPQSARDLLAALACARSRCTCQRSRDRGYGNTHCPAHEDGSPSLTVTERNGRVLVNCKSGCGQREVIEALKERQLWVQEQPSTPSRNTKRWPYRDEHGEVLAYHCRVDKGNEKIVWWQGPDGQKSSGEIQAAELPLYRAADIGKNPGYVILLCEGEKAADAAAEHNFVAVSFAGGASQTDFGTAPDALRGRDVVLWPDADEAGHKFMQRVDLLLRPIAERVRWLTVPDPKQKDDAFDFFARGGTEAELERLVEAARPATPGVNGRHKLWTLQELLATHFEPPTWLLPDLIPEVGLTILGGKPKVGKSWLALQIAGAIGVGDEVFGRRAVQRRVLYFCIEDHVPRTKSRWRLQENAEDGDVVFDETLEPLDGEGMNVLEALIGEVRPAFVVIDTLASAKSGKVDENAAGPMADILNALQRMAHSRRLSILLVAHHRKGAIGDPGADLRGSSAISAAADMLMSLVRKPPVYALAVEGRDTEDAEYRMEFEDYRWKLRGDERLLAKLDAEQSVFEVLGQLGESDAGAVARELGWSRSTAMRTLKELEFKHMIRSRVDKAYGERVSRILYRIGGPQKVEDS